MIKKQQTISREQFSNLMITSLCDMQTFNSQIEELGVTVKPYIGYEYYIGSNFICSTEDLCVDNLIKAAGFTVEELINE